MDSVEDYTRRWAKEEQVEVDTLSNWVKSKASFVDRYNIYLRRENVNPMQIGLCWAC